MPESIQQEFLRRMDVSTPFYSLFDHMPGVSFFAKNASFQIVCANKAFLERFGFRQEREIIGKSDYELFPEQLADHFRRGDEEVMSTGKAKQNIVELFFNRQGVPDWYITNKLPVRDAQGCVIGVMGTVQSHQRRRDMLLPYLQIDRPIQYIKEHFRERISIESLAKMANLSVRQLNRRFKETMQASPQAFIMKMRIQAACEALRSSEISVGELALDLGFYDQSSFTMQFRRHMGDTPLRYRRRYQ